MKSRIGAGFTGLLVLLGFWASAPMAAGQEVIVAIRHGEKPPGGLGQLNCTGLNRALALPKVLVPRFGKPDAIFAPDPAYGVNDRSKTDYSYVRPLITIEPTAIALGMPVNAEIGFKDITQLQTAVTAPVFANARVYIAWEHVMLNEFAKQIMQSYGDDPAAVPDWPNSDYDRIYLFTITQDQGKPKLAFRIEHEGLDGKLSETCPGPAQ